MCQNLTTAIIQKIVNSILIPSPVPGLLLPRPENGPGTQAGKERVLYYLQAHARNEPIRLQKIEQRRLLSDWLLKIVASSFQTAHFDVNKDGVRSDDFNFVLLPSFVLYVEGGL